MMTLNLDGKIISLLFYFFLVFAVSIYASSLFFARMLHADVTTAPFVAAVALHLTLLLGWICKKCEDKKKEEVILLFSLSYTFSQSGVAMSPSSSLKSVTTFSFATL